MRIEKERDEYLDTLTTLKESKTKDAAQEKLNQTKVQAISVFVLAGRRLLAKKVTTEKQWQRWKTERSQCITVLNVFGQLIGVLELSRICQVVYNPLRNYVSKFDGAPDEHQKMWNEMDAMVKAADDYLRRLTP